MPPTKKKSKFFHKNMRYLRQIIAKGMSTTKFGLLFGIKKDSILQYERPNGSVPNAARLNILAEFFNISVENLLNKDLEATKFTPLKEVQDRLTNVVQEDVSKYQTPKTFTDKRFIKIYEQLKADKKIKGGNTANDFALSVGLSTYRGITYIRAGQNNVTAQTITNLIDTYPFINANYLFRKEVEEIYINPNEVTGDYTDAGQLLKQHIEISRHRHNELLAENQKILTELKKLSTK